MIHDTGKILHRQLMSRAWQLFGTFSLRGLNPIQQVYDPGRPDGRLNFNRKRL